MKLKVVFFGLKHRNECFQVLLGLGNQGVGEWPFCMSMCIVFAELQNE